MKPQGGVMGDDKLALVHKAIRAGILGNIQWKDAAAQLVRNDPNLVGLTPEGIRSLLREFVKTQGGCLDVRKETRKEYLEEHPDDPFWYRAVLDVPGFPSELFVEVLLVDDDPEEPFVEIVSAHL
jgi:hypothetical protein